MSSNKKVLKGIYKLSFNPNQGRVELSPFPSSFRSCMDFIGEKVPYEFAMGVSGAAFRLQWNSKKLDGGNSDIRHITSNPITPFKRAFEAIGYSYQILFKSNGHDKRDFLNHIKESIYNREHPVIAFGVIGPPECCVIAGYDKGGEALIGWNFFQNQKKFNQGVEKGPYGYFSKENWFANTEGLILIGDKEEKPLLNETYRKSLEWGLEIMQTPMVGDYHNGHKAFLAFADALRQDSNFPKKDIELLRHNFDVYNDSMTTVAEGRGYGAMFLRQIAEHQSNMSYELLKAAECFEAQHGLIWKGWKENGGVGLGLAKAKNFTKPEIRNNVADIIVKAHDKNVEAAQYIDQALSK